MKRRFRLASVLRIARVREQLEEQKAAERTRAEAAAAREAAARAEAITRLPATDDFLADRQRAELRATAAVEASSAHDDARQQLATARAQWHDALRRVRSLEELEARHKAAFAVFASRAAQRALDDLVRTRRQR